MQVAIIGIALLSVLAWANHAISCFANHDWGFLIAGALFFPVGILHGLYLWMT